MLTKKVNRGLKARWPELEGRVHRWALEQLIAGRGLLTVQLRLHALSILFPATREKALLLHSSIAYLLTYGNLKLLAY